jgi:hypothetical protein
MEDETRRRIMEDEERKDVERLLRIEDEARRRINENEEGEELERLLRIEDETRRRINENEEREEIERLRREEPGDGSKCSRCLGSGSCGSWRCQSAQITDEVLENGYGREGEARAVPDTRQRYPSEPQT